MLSSSRNAGRYFVMFLKALLVLHVCCLYPTSHVTTWKLAMNINPSDGNIMQYCHSNWVEDIWYKRTAPEFTSDYVNRIVRNEYMGYIAVMRHKNGIPDAVKAWKLKNKATLRSLFSSEKNRFIGTEGGDIHREILGANKPGDPIFSVNGNLVFNWRYADNGCRLALDGGHLSDEDSNDDNTHGIGTHYKILDFSICNASEVMPCQAEVTQIQDCALKQNPPDNWYHECGDTKSLGTDSTGGEIWCNYTQDAKYGDYAIFISTSDSFSFPKLGMIRKLTLLLDDGK